MELRSQALKVVGEVEELEQLQEQPGMNVPGRRVL